MNEQASTSGRPMATQNGPSTVPLLLEQPTTVAPGPAMEITGISENESESSWTTTVEARILSYTNVAHHADATIRAQAQHRADNDLEALAMFLPSFKTRRNALSPISRLPAELFSRIFALHAINYPPGCEGDPGEHPSQARLGWISVTHVCRRWRQIALEDSTLWRTICFSLGDSWIDEMLLRSRSAPIIFIQRPESQIRPSSSDHGLSTTPQGASALVKHLSHIQILELYHKPEIMRPLLNLLLAPAPLLEELRLAVHNVNEMSTVRLPPNILHHEAPRIREMSLIGFQISWPLYGFPGLKKLHLELKHPLSPASHESVPPTLPQLLEMLEQMPGLQALKLRYCLPLSSQLHSVTKDHGIVTLAQLRELHLSGYASECLTVLRNLHFPSTATLQVQCSGSLENVQLLLQVVSIRLHTAPPIRTLALWVPPTVLWPIMTDSMTVSGWYQPSLPGQTTPVEPPSTQLSLTWPSSIDDFAMLQRVSQTLPLSSLKSLSISARSVRIAQHWIDLAGRFPQLEHVCSRGHGAMALSEALLPRAEHEPFLPSLRSLKLWMVDFSESASLPATEPYYVLLPKILRCRRAQLKPGLQVLELAHCRIQLAWMDELKEVVPEVIWDGLDLKGQVMDSQAQGLPT